MNYIKQNMESQSVSAQLYFKQLANQQGDQDSDSSIENAFQKQLDLSEYYKSKTVFDTMKRDYMDKTREGSDSPPAEVPVARPTTSNENVTPKNINVGTSPVIQKSIFGKSTFGASGDNNNIYIIILVLLIVAGLYFFLMKPN